MRMKIISACAMAIPSLEMPSLTRAADPVAAPVTNTAQDTLWQAWGDLWNGNYKQAEIISSDFRLHAAMMDGSSDAAIHGPDGITQWIKQARAPFRDMRFETRVGPLVSGSYIAGRWTVSGAYQGSFPGATAEPGTIVTFSGTDILRVGDGKIVEYWLSSDTLSLLSQLKVR